MKFSRLVEHVSKRPIPVGVERLIVEVMVMDEEGEDVEVRRFHVAVFLDSRWLPSPRTGSLHRGWALIVVRCPLVWVNVFESRCVVLFSKGFRNQQMSTTSPVMTDASISTEVPQIAVPPGVTPTSVVDPSAPQEPEYTSETLYIQNLNENVKIDGHCTPDIPWLCLN
jgi:hypothetical protein